MIPLLAAPTAILELECCLESSAFEEVDTLVEVEVEVEDELDRWRP